MASFPHGRRTLKWPLANTQFALGLLLHYALVLRLVGGIPVDNGVEGEPLIECGATFIGVTFQTRNPFEGHVFVKTLYNQPECRNDEGGTRDAGIRLAFDSCNVRRTRSLNPKGVFVSVTVIITFHPLFITKVDRAYNFQCFYMESDKTVSTDLDVSMLTTQFRTQNVPMPVCRYEILDGGPNGPPVGYALVGQAVYHKWTCDTETVDIFCMQVHTCYVDDGSGDRVHLLDGTGCAQDRYLLRNLEYDGALTGGQETHVFKYADRPALFFQCQITISIKEPFADCVRPLCEEPFRGKRDVASPGFGGDLSEPGRIALGLPPSIYGETDPAAFLEFEGVNSSSKLDGNDLEAKHQRRAALMDSETVGVVDVSTIVESIDIDDHRNKRDPPPPIPTPRYSPVLNSYRANGNPEGNILGGMDSTLRGHLDSTSIMHHSDEGHCFSTLGVGMVGCFMMLTTFVAVGASTLLIFKIKRGLAGKEDREDLGVCEKMIASMCLPQSAASDTTSESSITSPKSFM